MLVAPPGQSSAEGVPTTGVGLHRLMGWLHRLLGWQIALTRHTFGALAEDEYRGLYIPDAEVEILGVQAAEPPPELAAQRASLAAERAELQVALADSADHPLQRLAARFGLSPLECDVLLLALAPELDLRYERLYAYIQDDVTRRRPSVDLALRLLVSDPREGLAARTIFAPEAPLLHFRLVQLIEEGQRHTPLLARYLKLDERIVAELIDQPAPDALIAPFVCLSRPTRQFADLVLAADLLAQIRRAAAAPVPDRLLALQGNYGSGRRAIAEALAAERGQALLAVDLPLLRESELLPNEALRRIGREALLQDALILWQGADLLLASEPLGPWGQTLLATLDEPRGLTLLTLNEAWEPRGVLRQVTYLRLTLPAPSFSEREQLWRGRLKGGASPELLQTLASTFRLSGGQIRDAAAMAQALAHWHEDDDPVQALIRPADLYAACRAQSSGRMRALAHQVQTTYHWDDIVLPSDQIALLREICFQVRYRRIVLEQWGFDRHLAMGKGVNVLFAGPSGTGKTMAAEIIAAELGLELYKVDLSSMVSKYIGETEKNLERIFTAAREANAILFFDEADAIFGKRSEVKDAHDRYANIEVGYLLQKMEEYDGVVILATNLRKNLDDAFVRRLHVAIDFPFPEEPDRLRIWQRVFPPEAPLAAEVDLALLARRLKLAGGNIRNIALLAAYLAAHDGPTINLVHVVRAARREYQKLGRLVTPTEFGEWMDLLRERP